MALFSGMGTSPNQEKPRIVVGVDGSASSVAALRWAARVAPALDATITAVTAWYFPVDTGFGMSPPPAWDPEAAATEAAEEALVSAFGSEPLRDWSYELSWGMPPLF